jgi:hypothetical protein
MGLKDAPANGREERKTSASRKSNKIFVQQFYGQYPALANQWGGVDKSVDKL